MFKIVPFQLVYISSIDVLTTLSPWSWERSSAPGFWAHRSSIQDNDDNDDDDKDDEGEVDTSTDRKDERGQWKWKIYLQTK